jgi:hypothetical protein
MANAQKPNGRFARLNEAWAFRFLAFFGHWELAIGHSNSRH